MRACSATTVTDSKLYILAAMSRLVLPLLCMALILPRVVYSQELGSANMFLASFSVDGGSTFTAEQICRIAPNLNNAQRDVCVQSPQSMGVLQNSVSVFNSECLHQFKNERWNCSGSVPPFFGDTSRELKRATKEHAFVHALTSATAVHAVTTACSEGRINGCTCDNRLNGQRTPDGAIWGGCSDNVEYGVRFARDFLDARETEGLHNRTNKEKDLALVNLHNNNVGRKVVQDTMKTVCKCHGISGTCSLKTCWRVISSMREIGHRLKVQHNSAVQVSVEHRSIGPPVIRTSETQSMTPRANHLVYIKSSINYCVRNRRYTYGRECVPRGKLTEFLASPLFNNDIPVCEDICCGQRYEEKQRSVGSYYCNCRFEWCCDIVCDICTDSIQKYHCTN